MRSSVIEGRRVLVTGVTGLVGGAVAAHFKSMGAVVIAPTRSEVDLRDAQATRRFFAEVRPSVVVSCAARVGGIAANMAAPVSFLVENLEIQNSTLLAAADIEVDQFVFMASSCIYPRDCPQPMSESMLMTGSLEPTNESYAVAKLAGIQLARALDHEGRLKSKVLVPCNIYGPDDTFDPQRAHVTSALVRKFVEAANSRSPEVIIWGTGRARRELMHSSDLARAVEHVLSTPDLPFIVNVGTGVDHSILELAEVVASEVGFHGHLRFDDQYPDGMPQKVLDISIMADSGWKAKVALRTGVAELVAVYQSMSEGGVC